MTIEQRLSHIRHGEEVLEWLNSDSIISEKRFGAIRSVHFFNTEYSSLARSFQIMLGCLYGQALGDDPGSRGSLPFGQMVEIKVPKNLERIIKMGTFAATIQNQTN